jgi:hypothetical protein
MRRAEEQVTTELIGRAKAALEGITPCPWGHRIAPHDDEKVTHAEWLAKSLVDDGEALHVLIAESPEPERYAYIVPAVTGDGPNSAKNADFIAAARDLIPELVSALEDAYKSIRALVEPCEVECTECHTRWKCPPMPTYCPHCEKGARPFPRHDECTCSQPDYHDQFCPAHGESTQRMREWLKWDH